MPASYFVKPESFASFKEPFGVLIQGSFSETAGKLEELIDQDNPTLLVSVGDTVSRNLHAHKIIPQLSITDNLSMRRKVQPQIFTDKEIVKVKNPQGTITQQAIDAIQAALKSGKHTQIVVEGEEDLLTLIVVLYAPENALVVYGQPRKGLVVVKVTPQKRAAAEKIWKTIQTEK